MDGDPVVCVQCGRSPTGDDPPGDWRLSWTLQRERGADRWCCDGCARKNLRSIETKVDTAWW